MRCKCKHKSHRGICLRSTAVGKTFDNQKELCFWCAKNVHENKHRTYVKTAGDGNWW